MPQQPIFPVSLPLGDPTPVPGKPHTWVIKKRAIQGERYLMICPECKTGANRTMEKLGVRSRTCPQCQAVTYYKVVAAPAPQQPAPQPEQQSALGAFQAQVQAVGGQSAPKKPTQRLTLRGQSAAELTWGGLFRSRSYRLPAGITTLGREDSELPSDVAISDSYVSRQSAKIEVTEAQGGFNYKFTVDNATNPVLVNGKELRPGNAIYLNFGDTITMGRTRLTFKKS